MKKFKERVKEWLETKNYEIAGIALIIVICIAMTAIGVVIVAKFI